MTHTSILAHITAPELGWGFGLLAAGALLGALAVLALVRRARR